MSAQHLLHSLTYSTNLQHSVQGSLGRLTWADRVARIRRNRSTAHMFPVSGPKAQALVERLHRLGIRDNDLAETFVRSGGKGGQNVNKVSTCVVLLHRPTGTLVKCQ